MSSSTKSHIGTSGPAETTPVCSARAASPARARGTCHNLSRATEAFYATRLTKATVFLRTFVPWQLWRFAVIDLKMLRIIARSHRTH